MDLVKNPTALSTPDESLINFRNYRPAEPNEDPTIIRGLINPSDSTVRVSHIVLDVFDKHFLKKIDIVGLRKLLILKAKQMIFKEDKEWVKSECLAHRDFFVSKIVTAKLRRKLQDMSKDMRQPGGKNNGLWRKEQNVKNT